MSELFDISGLLRHYIINKSDIKALVGNRIYAGGIPIHNGETSSENVENPKVGFRQNGGDPKGMNYRYIFICRADTLIIARKIAILIINRLTKENFALEDVDGNNLAYWAELEGSLIDSIDDITGNPEVFFNINFEAIQ